MYNFRDNYDNHTMYELGNSLDLLNDPNYDANLPTVIYAHGWTESPNSRSTRTVVESYFNRGGWNTIVVNWQTLASPDYPTSARNVQYVSISWSKITKLSVIDIIFNSRSDCTLG